MRHHYWEWPIATYLFLGGMGGGMFFIAAVLSFFVLPEQATMLGSVLAWPTFFALVWLAVGCFLLVFELGQHYAFVYVFFNSMTSVIGHGARLLCVALIFGLFWWISYLPWEWISGLAGFFAVFRSLNLALAGLAGFCIMLYTGVLFSTLKAHSFWATPALPVLFTISALSTACACTMLCLNFTGLYPDMGVFGQASLVIVAIVVHEMLHALDIVLILAEITVLLLLVLSLLCAGNKVAHQAAERWVRGSYAKLFWIGMVGCGLVLPLLFNIIGLNVPAAVLALCGGLLLRFLIVFTDDRAEVPGETRYFSRLKKPGAEFMTKWADGEKIY